jgi:hypothetical protein
MPYWWALVLLQLRFYDELSELWKLKDTAWQNHVPGCLMGQGRRFAVHRWGALKVLAAISLPFQNVGQPA